MLIDNLTRGPLREAAGDPAGGGGAITMDAVKAEITTAVTAALAKQKVDTDKTLGTITASLTAFGATLDGLKPAPTPDPKDPKDPKPGSDPQVNAQLQALEANNKQLQARLATMEEENKKSTAAAEVAERHSKIREKLSSFEFADDPSRQAAFKLFSGDVRRGEDGALIAGDAASPLPFDKYIEAQILQLPGLLAAKKVGGAGAGGGAGGGNGAVTLDNIKPGMSAEDKKAVYAAIASIYPEQ